MNALLIYAGKVIACSALLYFYYAAALRNRPFHRFNRFYLLAILPLSLAVPLLRWKITTTNAIADASPVKMLRIVGSANDYVEGKAIAAAQGPSLEATLVLVYGAITLSLLIVLLRSFRKMRRLTQGHAGEPLGRFRLYLTELSSAPFTFFRSIFWNVAIDRTSPTGRRILEHELVHARQGHSWDVLSAQLVLTLCWWNPVFWFLRRELRQVHEFLADGTAGGSAELAAMILHASYPAQYDLLVQPFFQTSVKRRLHVLNRPRTPRLIGRLLVLPLLALAIAAFALRTENGATRIARPSRIYTVVVDAGHGHVGDRASGARWEGVNEDDVVLALAKQVQQDGGGPDIRIVLTRTGAENVGLKDRVAVAEKSKADLFISLHMNALPQGGTPSADAARGSGIEVFVSKDSSERKSRSLVLASALQQALGAVYPAHPGLLELAGHVWVIDHNTCPAVLVEMGYVTNDQDRNFMSSEGGRRKMAESIITAIRRTIGSQP